MAGIVVLAIAAQAHADCDDLLQSCLNDPQLSWTIDISDPGDQTSQGQPSPQQGRADSRDPSEFKDTFTPSHDKLPGIEKRLLPDITRGLPGDYIYLGQRIVSFLPGKPLLASAQSAFRTTTSQVLPADHTEPVAQNGEFTVDDTDVVIAGFGMPFTFSRHYRSGVDFQSPLGFGWNHTFGGRLVEVAANFSGGTQSCEGRNDIFYLDEHMNRIRFSYDSTTPDGAMDQYLSADPGPQLRLVRMRRPLT